MSRTSDSLRRGVRPWLQALGLAMGPLVALGLARFAYALLLPPMRLDLGWSFTQAGGMNTANAVGYLAGAVVATWLVGRLEVRQVFLAGIAATAVTLLTCATTGAFWLLALLRLGAGAAGAITFVAGAALAARAGVELAPRPATMLLATYVAGGGMGIVLSGLVVPPVLIALDPAVAWRVGWLVLGLVSLAALPPAAMAARAVASPAAPPVASRSGRHTHLVPTAAAYTLFGVGYVGYTTFIVALLQAGLTPGVTALFWLVLGAAAIVASFACGPLLGRARGGRGLAGLLAVVAVGAAVPVLTPGPAGALVSAVLFGGAFLSTVTAVTAVVRRTLPPHRWGPAIGALTVGFAAGQCAGPLLTGAVADRAGLTAGLAISAAVLGTGALVALLQHDHRRPDGTRT
jgi:predicted MFS family arabinose efflux permease